MTADTAGTLGEALDTFPTDQRRCARTAAVLLALGAAGVAAGLPLLLWWFADDRTGSNVAAGAPLGLGALCLACGVSRAVWAWRMRGEVFVVHRGGLARRAARGGRAVPWTDVLAVEDAGSPVPGLRFLGTDVLCRVRLRDGGTLLVTGFTRDAERLSRALRDAVGGRRIP
ncbi:PH domain-containing protein [Streptomyces sp. RFCAC02]|uniref:PH domain-containing protein n=1 Tax=Streptomyces sp. RFCAC02 TaxID=2499143 RepID=UPI0010207DF1|nr:PH domain-containing protein [Streptomyces sp. RFCAC02]